MRVLKNEKSNVEWTTYQNSSFSFSISYPGCLMMKLNTTTTLKYQKIFLMKTKKLYFVLLKV